MTSERFVGQIAWTIALLLSGVTAGMFLMDCFGYYPLLSRLEDHAAIGLHQESLTLRRGLFRLAISSSGVTCLAMIVFFSRSASRGLLIGSLACLIALVVYTNYASVPLNQEIAMWTADAPPAGWKKTFSDMIFREQLRSALPGLAFVLAVMASRWPPPAE